MSAHTWQVESLRKTYFFPADAEFRHEKLWLHIVGSEPSERNEKPAARVISESGDWKDHKLVVGSQPGRVDVLLQAVVSSPDFPNAGKFEEVAGEFRVLQSHGLPRTTRIAFGAVLLSPDESREACYRKLGNYLAHIKIDPASKEFSYSINNPRDSNVLPGAQLNCISKWAALQAQFTVLPSAAVFDRYAVRLEIDVSTDSTKELPEGVDVAAVFGELMEVGTRISQEGAKP